MPGMAGQATIFCNHSASHDRRPARHLGRHPGQPDLGRDARGGAHSAGRPSCSTSPSTGTSRSPASFAGDLDQAHAAGLRCARQSADGGDRAALRYRHHHQLRLPARPEPVPGRQGHERRGPGGAPGRGDHHRRRVLGRHPRARPVRRAAAQAGQPASLLETIIQPGSRRQDQWQAQVQAQMQLKADVYVYSRRAER